MRKQKVFIWSGWIKTTNQTITPMGYHVIAVNNRGEFEVFDIDKKGKKIKCRNHINKKL